MSDGVAGMAWDDDDSLRVAWAVTPDEGVEWLPDVVKTETITAK